MYTHRAVTLIQNAGSALNLHTHAHAVVLDGLFVGNQEEELCFVEIQPTTQDVMAIIGLKQAHPACCGVRDQRRGCVIPPRITSSSASSSFLAPP
jgi:hypothetical protein